MQMRTRLEALIDEMLDGQIMLDEAVAEFEKLYIQKALARHKEHLSRTAATLGIHRNTLSKRVANYRTQERSLSATRTKARSGSGRKPDARRSR
ncbi:MAG TPA: helix-turn-helix domain-containing protein [Pyrinomonadaceae bacterium]|jgi:DNA-binding NtrC family response regulator|nr:helix-turn-helix domain-containing protein [Pyrinomonadaceae bacterium]